MDKASLTQYFDRMAVDRDAWKARNRYYYAKLEELYRSIVPPGQRVLELGCGTGDLLAAVHSARGVGIDLSHEMVRVAQDKYPHLEFRVGDVESLDGEEQFEYVLMSDLVGHLYDIEAAFTQVHHVCRDDTRLVINCYNFVWEPVLRIAERIGQKMPQGYQNWLGMADMRNLLYLCDFQIEQEGTRLLIPKNLPGVSDWVNARWENHPLFAWASLVQYFVAKPKPLTTHVATIAASVSVIVPCRNEVDNIEACVSRTPKMGQRTEIIFVDGASTDGTWERIQEMVHQSPGEKEIKALAQIPDWPYERAALHQAKELAPKMLPQGKGDAVRRGFAAANGDILMILDADLTVPPENLPKFYTAIVQGKGDFINGTRLVYPVENEAMPVVNYFGNRFFSLLFTWLLGQPIKDTLCGTKVLWKKDYARIDAGRKYFGDFDPFGDFDLLFGAARLGLKIVELPIRYRRRVAGQSKVRVVQHGWLLLRMSWIGFVKFKLRRWVRTEL